MNKGFDVIRVQSVTNLTTEQKEYLNRVGMLEWIFRVKISGVKNDPWEKAEFCVIKNLMKKKAWLKK